MTIKWSTRRKEQSGWSTTMMDNSKEKRRKNSISKVCKYFLIKKSHFRLRMNLRTDFPLKTRLVYRRSLFHGSSLTTDFAENEFNSLPRCSSPDINLAHCNFQSKSFAVKNNFKMSAIMQISLFASILTLFHQFAIFNDTLFENFVIYSREFVRSSFWSSWERLSLFLSEYYTKRNGIK